MIEITLPDKSKRNFKKPLSIFELAEDIDPEYCESLMKAVKKNLNLLCYDCKFSSKGIRLNRNIQFKI